MDQFTQVQSNIHGSYAGNSGNGNIVGSNNTITEINVVHAMTNSGVGNQSGELGVGDKEARPYRLIPYGRNSTFTGRKNLLESVKRFSESKSHNRIALYGLGGSGKTQIVLEYVHQRTSESDCDIYWVQGSGPLKFSEGFRAIAQLVGIHLASTGTDEEDFLLGVRRWFEGPKSGDWILVIDNADNEADFVADNSPIAKFIPQGTKGTLILTTRSRQVASRQGCEMIKVAKMGREEAEQLFAKRLGRWNTLGSEEKKVIAMILSSVDHLPLAVVGSAAFMVETETPPSVYWAIFQENEERMGELLSEQFNDIQREADATESILGTYFVTFDRIRQQMPRAADLLWLMACFDRQNIPEELLSQCGLEGMDNSVGFRRAIGKLLGFSLVTIVTCENKTFYELHRLVQLSLQLYLPTRALNQWRATALQVVSRCFPEDENERRCIGPAYIPHALAVTKDSTDPIAEELCFRMGRYFLDMGYYNNAETQFRRCIVLREEGRACDLGEQGLLRFMFLGEAKLYQGKYGESEDMNRRAMAGCEKVLGPDHPTTLASLNNLGIVLCKQGRYKESEMMNRCALEGREKVLGSAHPDTLSSVHNLARVLYEQGRYHESEAMNRRALEGRERVLGQNHPHTLLSVNNLAMVLCTQGRYKESEMMNRCALEGREKVLGSDHPNTLTSVHNLARALYDQGRYHESETMNRCALEGRERVLGPDNPETLSSINGLAVVLSDQRKFKESETMYRRALEGREKVLGPDHPETLTSVSNLATVLYEQGRYHESETTNRRALEARERVLGPDHPDTLSSVNNLAIVLGDQGRCKESETMYQHALEGREKVLGLDHPETLLSVSNLATVLQNQGRYKESEKMHRRALEGRERALGLDHPHTLESVNNLARALKHQGKYDESEVMEGRVLQGHENVLGRDKPTQASTNNLAVVLGKQGESDELERVDESTQASLPIKPDRERPRSTGHRALRFIRTVVFSKGNGQTK